MRIRRIWTLFTWNQTLGFYRNNYISICFIQKKRYYKYRHILIILKDIIMFK